MAAFGDLSALTSMLKESDDLAAKKAQEAAAKGGALARGGV